MLPFSSILGILLNQRGQRLKCRFRVYIQSTLAIVFIALSYTPANTQDIGDAFRRGLEDGNRIKEFLFRGQERADLQGRGSRTLEARQAEVLQLQQRGELSAALSAVEALLAEILERFGDQSLEYAATIGIKGSILQDLGQYEAAMASYRSAAEVSGATSGEERRYYGRDLINLANLYYVTGRYDAAIALLRESLEIGQQRSNVSPQFLEIETAALVSLGEVLRADGQLVEAKSILARAIDRGQDMRPASPLLVGTAVLNLGLIQAGEGNAEVALENIQKLWPFVVGTPLGRTTFGLQLRGHRALLLSLLNRHREAETAAREAVGLAERNFPNNTTIHAKTTAALGVVLLNSGSPNEAYPELASALQDLTNPVQQIEDLVAPPFEEQRFRSLYMAALAEAIIALKTEDANNLLFRIINQMDEPAAGRALRQSILRAAAADPVLAKRVRRLQDTEAMFLAKRRELFGLPLRDGSAREAALREAISDLLAQRQRLIRAIRLRSAGRFDLRGDETAELSEVQQFLEHDEALVRIVETPSQFALTREVFVWAVTHDTQRLVPVEMTVKQTQRAVAVLRCGLDNSYWADASNWPIETNIDRARREAQLARRDRCVGLTGKSSSDHQWPQFDLDAAHQLYRALFGEIEDLIENKQLLIVPSPSLASLPPHVLSKKSESEAKLSKDPPWLGLQHAITILPSAANLISLRQRRPAKRAPNPYRGYGAPELAGHPNCEAPPTPSECPTLQLSGEPGRDIAFAALSRAPSPNSLSSQQFFHETGADVDAVQTLCPLPDTAFETACVAESFGLSKDRSTITGPRMTEREVKDHPLSDYRVLHFATHGLVSDEMAQLAYGLAEPALVFTPPAEAQETDDGLLTASEIAALDLNADFVILSACNTGSAHGGRADSLSGLARAFFYAGARSLLVSHWKVNSAAATLITTDLFAEFGADRSVGRAEALRRAMASIARRGGAWSHPAIWAPFVIVGDGTSLETIAP